MKEGDRVRIRRRWCESEEEHRMVHVVVEARGDRVEISPVEWDGRIVPRETVRVEMLEPAGE